MNLQVRYIYITLIRFKHTLPDVFDIDAFLFNTEEYSDEEESKINLKMMMVFVGKGVFIKTLTIC